MEYSQQSNTTNPTSKFYYINTAIQSQNEYANEAEPKTLSKGSVCKVTKAGRHQK